MFLILSFFANVYYFLNIDVGKEVKEMYIKIYSKSQLILLRRLKPLFKRKYQLPNGILNKVENILKERELGKSGFVAICTFRINGAPFPRQRCKRLAPAVRYPFVVTC